MKIIAYKKEGAVRILAAVDPSLTFEQLKEQSGSEDALEIVKDSDLPDQYFFEAFDIADGKIVVDIEKAKEIRRDELLRLQARLVQELTQDYTKASVLGGDVGAIQRRASAVANMKFPVSDMPDDLEELKTYIPEGIQ